MTAKNISIPEVYLPAICFEALVLDIELCRVNCLPVFEILLLFNSSQFFEWPSQMIVSLFVCLQ